MAAEPDEPVAREQPVSTPLGIAMVLAVTLVLAAAVGLVLFEFPEEHRVPEIEWSIEEADDRPILRHNGGETVPCDRFEVRGDFTDGASLCGFFDGERIGQGDAAALMDTGGQEGRLELVWYDPGTDRWLSIFQRRYPPE